MLVYKCIYTMYIYIYIYIYMYNVCIYKYVSMEADVFSLLPGNTTRDNLTKEEFLAIRELAEDLSIVIKK